MRSVHPADPVAAVFEDLCGVNAEVGVVFHHQYSTLRATHFRLAELCGRIGLLGRLFHLWQVQGKGRPLALGAGYLYIAPGLLGEAEHLR
ncbi:hypothetical protein D3C79_895600 [compost metagenome]